VLRGDGKREVIAGVRPEHFEDAIVEPDKPGVRFTASVGVVESMGSELYAYFDVEHAQVESRELTELAADAGMEDLPQHGGDSQQVVARLDAASRARAGEQAQLVLDTDHIHLFDPETGRTFGTEAAAATA
jgi:multiple sugar transport system ATP-binding protein